MKYLIGVVLALSFFMISCAHHRDVRSGGSSGVHKVVLPTDNKDQGYREAISQAEDFCEKRFAKHPVVVTEGTQYTGNMKEEDYNKAKTAAKIATGVGSAGYIFGGKSESTIGGIVGLGGGIADGAIGQGYAYQMTFKCE